MTFVALLAAAVEEHAQQELFFPLWVFPLIATAFFALGAIIVFTYRDVANRHADKTGAASGHGAHGAGGHGADGHDAHH